MIWRGMNLRTATRGSIAYEFSVALYGDDANYVRPLTPICAEEAQGQKGSASIISSWGEAGGLPPGAEFSRW